jgi:hypothetical protein
MYRVGNILVLVAGLGLTACTSASVAESYAPASPVETIPTTPVPTESRTPAPSATASEIAPDAMVGELVVTFQSSNLNHTEPTSIVADGRVTAPGSSGYVQQRLSPAGVELIRQQIIASGLFSQTRDLPLPPAAKSAPFYCADGGLGWYTTNAIVLWTGNQPIRLTWQTPASADIAACHGGSPETDTADALLERLRSLDDWLPADAWSDPLARPYSPGRYRFATLVLDLREDLASAPSLAALRWPLEGTLRGYGEPQSDLQDREGRCAVVSAAQADQIMDALDDAGAQLSSPLDPLVMLGTYLVDETAQEAVAVVLEPLRPEESTCEPWPFDVPLCWYVGDVDLLGCPIH